MTIHHLVGDATSPGVPGPKIIAHVCNTIGKWGRGFVLAVEAKWPDAKEAYLRDFAAGRIELGFVRFVDVEPEIAIANMVGQRGIEPLNGQAPIRYWAIRACLQKVAAEAKERGASVHMPWIGAGLAGGNWPDVLEIIKSVLGSHETYVYAFNDSSARSFFPVRSF